MVAIIAAIGVACSIAGVAIKLIGVLSNQEELDDVLGAIGESGDELTRQITNLSADIHWSTIAGITSEHIDNIEQHFLHITRCVREKNTAEAQRWAEYVLDLSTGVAHDLFPINRLMMGENPMAQPLMRIFTDRLKNSGQLKQSDRQVATAFFRTMLGIQTRGLCALMSAYSIKKTDPSTWEDPNVPEYPTPSEVRSFLEPYEQMASQQVVANQKYVEGLERWWTPYGLDPRHEPRSYESFPYSEKTDGVHFVNLNSCTADPNHVIVGLQLYRGRSYQNQICIRITQAPLLPSGDVDFENITDKYPAENANCYNLLDLNPPYLDINEVNVPSGSVAIGAALYMKGNRLALKLQYAQLDLTLDAQGSPSQRRWWNLASGASNWTPHPTWAPPGDHYAPFYYYSGINRIDQVQTIDHRLIQPDPEMASYVTGAKLKTYGTWVGVVLNTVFFEMVPDDRVNS